MNQTTDASPSVERQTLTFRLGMVEFDFELEADEAIIANAVRTSGCWEPNQLELYPLLIGEGGTFVDVGANVGLNSIFAYRACPGCQVFSFEPSATNFETLQRNLARNGSPSRVVALRQAVADFNGTIGFPGSGTNAHLDPEAGPEVDRVDCRTLDATYAALGLTSVDLIKIDVEGYTDLVLADSSSALAITRHAIVEFSRDDTARRLADGGGQASPAAVTRHCSALFEILERHYHHFYYLSRHRGPVRLAEPGDLFNLMVDGPPVGDVLCCREPFSPSKSSMAYCLETIAQLMYENHLRIVENQRLDHRINQLEVTLAARHNADQRPSSP